MKCFVFFKDFLILFYVSKCFVCMCGAHGGQKGTSDSLELELQIVVSHHMCTGNQIWVLLSTELSLQHNVLFL